MLFRWGGSHLDVATMNPTTNCVPRWATGEWVDFKELCWESCWWKWKVRNHEIWKIASLRDLRQCWNLVPSGAWLDSFVLLCHTSFKGVWFRENFKHKEYCYLRMKHVDLKWGNCWIPELAEVGFVLNLDKRSFRLMKFYHFLQSGQSMESHWGFCPATSPRNCWVAIMLVNCPPVGTTIVGCAIPFPASGKNVSCQPYGSLFDF